MNKKAIREFLNSVVIDPKDTVTKLIIENGSPANLESKAIEYLSEARRIRQRMEDGGGQVLLEFYQEKLRLAIGMIALAEGAVSTQHTPIPKPEVIKKEPEPEVIKKEPEPEPIPKEPEPDKLYSKEVLSPKKDWPRKD